MNDVLHQKMLCNLDTSLYITETALLVITLYTGDVTCKYIL